MRQHRAGSNQSDFQGIIMAEAIITGTDPTGRLGHPKYSCTHCNGIFTCYPSRAKITNPKYCSTACKYDAFRTNGWPAGKQHLEVCCSVCGKVALANPARAKTQRFCSQKCMMVWRGPVISSVRFQPETHIKLKCEVCGDEFNTATSRIKDGRGRFCSRECVGAWTVRNQNRVSFVEKTFFDALEIRGLTFRRQCHVGKWTVDAVFDSAMIAIEFDGEYWHSLPKAIERDARKDADLISKGYKVIRIPERMHRNNPELCIQMVVEALSI